MKVRIDATRCEGTGYCQAVDDRVFRLVDGVARVQFEDGDPALAAHGDDVLEAEALCPTGAIRVVA